MNNSGEQILQLLDSESGEVVLVCPFIKSVIIQRLLNTAGEGTQFTVYTRWLPNEIAAGVSDLEVYNLVNKYGGKLFLLHELHAKMYMRGGRALIGSANMTGSGTGWAQYPNLEILVEVDSQSREVIRLIDRLQSASRLATSKIQEVIRTAAAQLENQSDWTNKLHETAEFLGDLEEGVWLPHCTTPTRLWQVYSGKTRRMLESTVEDAQRDLIFLQSPKGLDEADFIAFIRAMLCQTTIFGLVDAALDRGEDPANTLSTELINLNSVQVAEQWEIIQSWLLHFFPDIYRTRIPLKHIQLSKSRQIEGI